MSGDLYGIYVNIHDRKDENDNNKIVKPTTTHWNYIVHTTCHSPVFSALQLSIHICMYIKIPYNNQINIQKLY